MNALLVGKRATSLKIVQMLKAKSAIPVDTKATSPEIVQMLKVKAMTTTSLNRAATSVERMATMHVNAAAVENAIAVANLGILPGIAMKAIMAQSATSVTKLATLPVTVLKRSRPAIRVERLGT